MLLFKFLANCFMLDSMRANMTKHEESVLDCISDSLESANLNSLLAISTLLFNFSVFYLRRSSEKGVPQLLSIIEQALKHKEANSEIQLRLLVALGTVIYSNKQHLQLAAYLGLTDTLQTIQPLSDQVKLCLEDVKKLFT